MSLKEALNIIKMEWQIMRYQLLRVKIADRLVKMSEYLYKELESVEGKQKQREIYEIVKRGTKRWTSHSGDAARTSRKAKSRKGEGIGLQERDHRQD